MQRRSARIFLNHKALRRAGAGVEEAVMQDVEFLWPQRREPVHERMALLISGLMTRIGADGAHAAGHKKRKCGGNGRMGGIPERGDGLVAAGEPAEVEHRRLHGRSHPVGDVLMVPTAEGATLYQLVRRTPPPTKMSAQDRELCTVKLRELKAELAGAEFFEDLAANCAFTMKNGENR